MKTYCVFCSELYKGTAVAAVWRPEGLSVMLRRHANDALNGSFALFPCRYMRYTLEYNKVHGSPPRRTRTGPKTRGAYIGVRKRRCIELHGQCTDSNNSKSTDASRGNNEILFCGRRLKSPSGLCRTLAKGCQACRRQVGVLLAQPIVDELAMRIEKRIASCIVRDEKSKRKIVKIERLKM